MQRLDATPNVYASPVAASGLIYIVGREGTTVVIEAGAEFKPVATNVLDEPIDASPALVGSEIYIRGTQAPVPHLVLARCADRSSAASIDRDTTDTKYARRTSWDRALMKLLCVSVPLCLCD